MVALLNGLDLDAKKGSKRAIYPRVLGVLADRLKNWVLIVGFKFGCEK